MMSRIKSYVVAMRLRTLPLSLAGVTLGLLLSAADYHVRIPVVVFTLLTTLFLQLLSNVSNELGDTLKGTDREDRLGPAYSLSSGLLRPSDLKMMIWISVILSVASGLAMIWFSFGTLLSLESILLMILGAGAISGAMRYTLGSNPYGYRGFGDLSVFIFFGIVAVLGSYFVASHEIRSWNMLLPAASIGCFSVAVLNVNNIRDMKSDAATRVTIPIKIGERGAKIYQTVLIVLGWACMTAYCLLRMHSLWHYLYVLTLPLFVAHVAGVWKRHGKDLDPMLPLLVVSIFFFALLAGFGFVVYLF